MSWNQQTVCTTGYWLAQPTTPSRSQALLFRFPPPNSPQACGWLPAAARRSAPGPTASTSCSWAHSSPGQSACCPQKPKPPPAFTEADPRHNNRLRTRPRLAHISHDPHSDVCLSGAAHLTAASGRIPSHCIQDYEPPSCNLQPALMQTTRRCSLLISEQ